MIPTFLFTLAGGMLLVLASGNYSEIAWKFLRICGYLALGMVTVAATVILLGPEFSAPSRRIFVVISGAVGGLSAAALAMAAPLSARVPQLTRGMCIVGGAAGVCASICNLRYGGADHQLVEHGLALVSVNQLSSAFLLGAITVAWLLGHAYLTATKMTIAPLRHFSRILSWAVALRVLLVVVSLILAARAAPSSGFLATLSNVWLVGSLRVALGLVAAAVFAYMVSDCVQRRSTQSATGILYFGSLFVYIGELAAQFLTRELGWPF